MAHFQRPAVPDIGRLVRGHLLAVSTLVARTTEEIHARGIRLDSVELISNVGEAVSAGVGVMANPIDLPIEVGFDTAEIEGIPSPGAPTVPPIVQMNAICREVIGNDVGRAAQWFLPEHGARGAERCDAEVGVPFGRGAKERLFCLGHGQHILRTGDILRPDEGAIDRMNLDHIARSGIHDEDGPRLITAGESGAVQHSIRPRDGHADSIKPTTSCRVGLGPDRTAIGSIQPGHPPLLGVADAARHDVIRPIGRLVDSDAESSGFPDAPRPQESACLPMDPVHPGHALWHEDQADVALTVGHSSIDLARRPVCEDAFPDDVGVVARRSRNHLRETDPRNEAQKRQPSHVPKVGAHMPCRKTLTTPCRLHSANQHFASNQTLAHRVSHPTSWKMKC